MSALGIELDEHMLEFVFVPSERGLTFRLICAACREHFRTVRYAGDGRFLQLELERRLGDARRSLSGDACPAA